MLSAASVIGEASKLLRMLFDAAAEHNQAVIGCYEHTREEFRFRSYLQSVAMTSSPDAE